MRQPMSVRERVLLTALVCLTILVAAPLTALAATGQLINIVDGTNAARVAKVTDVGALRVQTRPGIPDYSFNGRSYRGGPGWQYLYQVPLGRYTALVEATVSDHEGSGYVLVRIGWITVGTGVNCATYVGSVHGHWRQISIPVNTTVAMNFDGAPLLLGPPPANQKHCLGFEVLHGLNGATVSVGLSGYTYVP